MPEPGAGSGGWGGGGDDDGGPNEGGGGSSGGDSSGGGSTHPGRPGGESGERGGSNSNSNSNNGDGGHYDDAVIRAARQREAERQRQEAEQQRQADLERERFDREQRRLEEQRRLDEQERQAELERERFAREQQRLENERARQEAERQRQEAEDLENQPQLAFANQHTGPVFGIGWKSLLGSAHHVYAYLENPETGLRSITRVGVEKSSSIFHGRYTTEIAVPEARSSDKRSSVDLVNPAQRGEKVLAVGQDAEAAFAAINEVVSRLTSKVGYTVLNDNSNAAIALGLSEANLVPDIDSNSDKVNAALSRLTKDGSEPGFNAASAKDVWENSLRPPSEPRRAPTDTDSGSDTSSDDSAVTQTTPPISNADRITLPTTDNLVVQNGTQNSNELSGTEANDYLLGHGGNDRLWG